MIRTLVLAGQMRRMALAGKIPLEQLEATLSLDLDPSRIRPDNDYSIEVFASEQDRLLMEKMRENSVPLQDVTERARGDEMSAAGLFWRCPSCSRYTVPGRKKKGGGYRDKICVCKNKLSEGAISSVSIISEIKNGIYRTEFIDGFAIPTRYSVPEVKYIREDLELDPPLKPADLHRGPKILIRQAGVGIAATVVRGNARCPQSVYIYRTPESAVKNGYSLEFVLACLCSRAMNYFILKSFGEIDPARAFSKLTHERMATLPIAQPGRLSAAERARLSSLVGLMLGGGKNGSSEDFEIEHIVTRAWGLSPAAVGYVNSVFSLVPEGQMVRSLFPDGPPKAQRFPIEDFTSPERLPNSARSR